MNLDQPEIKLTRSITLIICITLLLTFLLSVIPQSQAAAVVCKYKHKVQQGETLTYIANLYGTSWQKIADANNMQPPYTVAPGQVLCIPEGDKNASTTPTSKKGKAASASGPVGFRPGARCGRELPQEDLLLCPDLSRQPASLLPAGCFHHQQRRRFHGLVQDPEVCQKDPDDDLVRQECLDRCSFLCEVPRVDLQFPGYKDRAQP